MMLFRGMSPYAGQSNCCDSPGKLLRRVESRASYSVTLPPIRPALDQNLLAARASAASCWNVNKTKLICLPASLLYGYVPPPRPLLGGPCEGRRRRRSHVHGNEEIILLLFSSSLPLSTFSSRIFPPPPARHIEFFKVNPINTQNYFWGWIHREVSGTFARSLHSAASFSHNPDKVNGEFF